MKKTARITTNSHPADFSRAKNPGFAPPAHGLESIARRVDSPATFQPTDLKPLLEKLLGALLSSVEADAGIIRIISSQGKALRPISTSGLPEEWLDMEYPLEMPCESCLKDAGVDGIYTVDIGSCGSRKDCSLSACRFQFLVAVPLKNEDSPETQAGLITLFFGKPQKPDKHTQILLRFAGLAAAIVKQNRSKREAKRMDLLAERQAIANEIHDSLAQTLAYARMRTNLLLESIRSGNEVMSAKYAHDIDEALEINQKTVRELITDFRCSMDPSGLLHALDTLTAQFSHRNAIKLEYINRVAQLELPLEYEIQVFHIVQEALSNIATHSGASHARLTVDFSENYYIFTIEDNGSGGCTFTPVEGHYGMKIMRERAQRIGGEIKVASLEGIGTHVQLYFSEPGTNWRTANE